MKRCLLDSNAVGHLIEKRSGLPDRVREARRNGFRIGIGTPVLAELYYGVEYSSTRDANLRRLERALSSLIIWPFDEMAAAKFGRLRVELRRKARPMQVIDIMIASIAISLGDCTVVTSDSDLSAIAGLKVEDWTS